MKAYRWEPEESADSCICVIADNSKEAKKIGLHFWSSEYGFDNDFTDIRVKWIKDKDLTGLQKGVVDWREGLKRDLYSWVEMECEICGEDALIYWDKYTQKALCGDCLYPRR